MTCGTLFSGLYNDLWHSIFWAPFALLRETKLQYFQFRFLNRILGTNYYLHLMNLRNDALCTFCNHAVEMIDHLFWDCDTVSSFYLNVEQSIFGRQFVFFKTGYFFSYKFLRNHPYNFLIFHLKYFIFSKKLDNKTPTLNDFLYKLKFSLNVEKYSMYSLQ